MLKTLAPVALLLTLIAQALPAWARDEPTGFLNKTAEAKGEKRAYVLYVPREYNDSANRGRKWPVILFLHGSGERGEDGLRQSEVGIGAAIRNGSDRFPALVVMPQCKPDQRWSDAMADYALRALDQTLTSYRTDKRRVYLTGLSMGGYGSWLIGAQYPERFAAIVPICGGGDPKNAAAHLTEVPVWAFHGGADPTVAPEKGRAMADALKAAGGTVKYTEYPGVGHNSWDRAYGEKDLTDWLFAQIKPAQPGKPVAKETTVAR